MSIDNRNNADPKIIYNQLNRPPVHNCGGELDKLGHDSYWGKSLTLQADAENADITLIMQKYAKTGIISAPVKQNPMYGDFSTVPDFQKAQTLVAEAHEQFDALSPKLRQRFHGNPEEMLAFLNDAGNIDEAIKLGLVSPKKVEDTIPTAGTTAKGSEEPKKGSEEPKK